jgi:hypothetical protein
MKHALKPSHYAILITIMLTTPAARTQTPAKTASPYTRSVVPFVGCKADGQAGPLDAPTGQARSFPIPAAQAQRLAYYKAEQGPGVLAPRGWRCFCTYGSSGGNLYVTPQQIDPSLLFSNSWKGFTGPVVQLSAVEGDTSGRFTVASIIARVFPAHRAFVRKVIRDGFGSATDFPLGPYPHDKLIYKNSETVEYETPANSEGLGTRSYLQATSEPIRGTEILVGDSPSLLSLSIRLPSNDTDLTSIIIPQTEQEAAALRP